MDEERNVANSIKSAGLKELKIDLPVVTGLMVSREWFIEKKCVQHIIQR